MHKEGPRGWSGQYLVWAQAGLGWLQEWLWWTEGQGLGPDTMSPLLLEAQLSMRHRNKEEGREGCSQLVSLCSLCG